eukprot:1379907-Amorphochlora_amoeboformis.AAC.1
MSENGCDSVPDIAISDVSTLVNVVGMSLPDANRLVLTAKRQFPHLPSIEDVLREQAAAEEEDEDEDEDENGVEFADSKRGTKRPRPQPLLGGENLRLPKESDLKRQRDLEATIRAEQEASLPGERRRVEYGLANYHPEAIVAILRSHMTKSVEGLQDVTKILPQNVMPAPPMNVEPQFRYVTLPSMTSIPSVIPSGAAAAAAMAHAGANLMTNGVLVSASFGSLPASTSLPANTMSPLPHMPTLQPATVANPQTVEAAK